MFTRRVDQYFAAHSAPRVLLRNFDRRGRRIESHGQHIIRDHKILCRLCSKTHSPFDLERVAHINVVVHNDEEFPFLVHEGPRGPGHFFNLFGILLPHGDNNRRPTTTAFREVNIPHGKAERGSIQPRVTIKCVPRYGAISQAGSTVFVIW